MADPQSFNWTGSSGQKYVFYLFALPTGFTAKQDGNYIFASFDNTRWHAVYIGQGDLQTRIAAGQADACIKSKASHVFARITTGGEDARRAIEADLLASYTEAYAPRGCNVKVGG
jgi:hypothetical protein